MGVKPALEGEKHAHANVGESRNQLKIPQKTVDLAVQKSHSCLWNDMLSEAKEINAKCFNEAPEAIKLCKYNIKFTA